MEGVMPSKEEKEVFAQYKQQNNNYYVDQVQFACGNFDFYVSILFVRSGLMVHSE